MKRRVDTILGKETTTFTLEVTKDKYSYKLPVKAEEAMLIGLYGLILMPHGVCDGDYDYRLIDDYISFSTSFMEELFKDGSEKEEIQINYNRLVEISETEEL